MGEEHGVTITDLAPCPECGGGQQLIFQSAKEKWWVSCGYNKCGHKTKEHVELLDAADEWGLKEMET